VQKDRYSEEDKHVLRCPGLGMVWTVLTNMAVSLMNLPCHGERTLKEVRENAGQTQQIPQKKIGLA
jgi:hypothetical protein